MEIMICEACGSRDTSEDLETRIHTCLKCGHKSKGRPVDFMGVTPNDRVADHSPKYKPFDLSGHIKRWDLGLLKK